MGSQAELRCHPPKGHPAAQVVSWLRNGVPIETKTDSNFIVSSTGHLLILQATLSDTANYSCVAANVARQRTSEAALVTIYSKYFNEIFLRIWKISNWQVSLWRVCTTHYNFKPLQPSGTITFIGKFKDHQHLTGRLMNSCHHMRHPQGETPAGDGWAHWGSKLCQTRVKILTFNMIELWPGVISSHSSWEFIGML